MYPICFTGSSKDLLISYIRDLQPFFQDGHIKIFIITATSFIFANLYKIKITLFKNSFIYYKSLTTEPHRQRCSNINIIIVIIIYNVEKVS